VYTWPGVYKAHNAIRTDPGESGNSASTPLPSAAASSSRGPASSAGVVFGGSLSTACRGAQGPPTPPIAPSTPARRLYSPAQPARSFNRCDEIDSAVSRTSTCRSRDVTEIGGTHSVGPALVPRLLGWLTLLRRCGRIGSTIATRPPAETRSSLHVMVSALALTRIGASGSMNQAIIGSARACDPRSTFRYGAGRPG
jgi:hypothetical protein